MHQTDPNAQGCGPGVIAGVISYIIAQLCKLILDKLEASVSGIFGKSKRTNYEGKDITLQPGTMTDLADVNDSAFNVCPDDVNPALSKIVPLPATLPEVSFPSLPFPPYSLSYFLSYFLSLLPQGPHAAE